MVQIVPGGVGGPFRPDPLEKVNRNPKQEVQKPDPSTVVRSSDTVEFLAFDYWQGIHLHVHGQTGGELLRRDPSNSISPADGSAYPLVTKSGWQVRCTIQAQNVEGQGFLAVSPEGVQYRFEALLKFEWVTGRED